MVKFLVPGGIALCGLFISVYSGFPQTWTQTSAPYAGWGSVASSADGGKLAAASSLGVYTSTNFGATWNASLSTNTGYGWLSVASSADGSVLIAGGGGTSANQVWISTNSGVSWKYTELGSHVASSADGKTLVAALGGFRILISTNAGSSWAESPSAPAGNWSCVASSADGSKLAAGVQNGAIYTSSDFGNTWTSNNVPNQWWSSIASSADGSLWVAVAGSFNGPLGPIYVSTNSGTNWVPAHAPITNWVSVTISADGSKLFALEGGAAFVSTNSGLTWAMASTTNASWLSMASSADGHKLVAGALGDIYTSQTTPSPQVNIAPTNGNLVLSWIVPSTNFVLQQNSDFTTTNWVDATNTPVLNLTNLENEVTLPLTDSNCFYRLATQ